MSLKILRAELTTHVHATEDESKVLQAVKNIIHNSELMDKALLKREVLQGHYSNPIIRVTMIFEKTYAEKLLRNIISNLGDIDRRILVNSLERRYDEKEGRLYIRFSKQDAFLGEVRLFDGDDVIRLVFVFRGSPALKDVMKYLREIGLQNA